MDEFETLLTSSRIAVDRWLKAHMGNCADAEDVLQETCLAAFQGCLSIVRNANGYDTQRKRRRIVSMDEICPKYAVRSSAVPFLCRF